MAKRPTAEGHGGDAEALADLLNDTLDLSKCETGQLKVERQSCAPAKVVADVVSLMRVRASSKNLELDSQCIGKIPSEIQTDATRLRQVLINLVGNALKFTEMGGVRVLMRLEDVDRQPRLRLDIVDTGIGMTAEQVDELLAPLTNADSSAAQHAGGTGLGLAISYRLTKMLGGDLSVRSTPRGGSTFTVTIATGPLDGIPLIDDVTEAIAETPPAAATDCRPADVPTDPRGSRILLAEDGPDDQRLIASTLRKAGADVTIAETGRVAHDLAIAAAGDGRSFDLILMDMQLPGMDGYAATRQLRDDGYAGPIIVLTAHAMPGDEARCRAAGCDDCLSKPVDLASLLSAVACHAWHDEAAACVTA